MLLLGQVALLVLVLQLEVGQVMVEFLLVQRNDVGVAPLVVGVAGRARLALHAPVISLLLREIPSDVLVRMAFHAQVVLLLLAEMGVAVLAIGLGLGVPLDQVTRLQHALEQRRARRRARQQRDSRQRGGQQRLQHRSFATHPGRSGRRRPLAIERRWESGMARPGDGNHSTAAALPRSHRGIALSTCGPRPRARYWPIQANIPAARAPRATVETSGRRRRTGTPAAPTAGSRRPGAWRAPAGAAACPGPTGGSRPARASRA